ncbi:MAG: xanthine dehydrogenase family protein molybdopterin-binding subunit [Anaerolineaceae bacterium]|nr:xanthine dehydrogenase family protein molybdopterin-binding subunit [Anaerolineaceae bacterium]
MKKLQFVNNPAVQPVDGLDKVLGKAKYVGDIHLPGMLHAKVLRSELPHAKIKRINTKPALNVPGVMAVITSDDFVENGSFGWPIKDAYILAYQKVRYVGDPIAVVAAESEKAAAMGIRAIELELEPLPIVSNFRNSLEEDTIVIPLEPNPEGGNLAASHIVRNGDPATIIDNSYLKFEGSYYFAHQEHAYLETEGAVALPEPDGGVTIFANDQSPFVNRGNAASVLGLDPEMVRIIIPPIGGSFGGKDDIGYQTTAQVAKLALICGRTVRMVLGREESMTASYKREAMEIILNIGVQENGKLEAVKADILADSGAYASMTPLSAWRATMHAAGAYKYNAASVDTKVVYTNNGYSGAFRGFGNTQAAAASEIAIDEIAVKLGFDPIDFRMKNCLVKGDKAFTGNPLDEKVTLVECLEWVRTASQWDKKRAEYQYQPSGQVLQKGIGVANYFHGAGLGGEGLDYAYITLEVLPDFTIRLQSGFTDYGQGSRTVFTLLAAEVLNVDPTRIMMPLPDTQTAMESGPTVASRASIVGGNAVRVSAGKILNQLNIAAADHFNCNVDEVRRFGEKFISPEEDEISFDETIRHAWSLGFQLASQGYWQIPLIHWDFEKGTGIPYYTYCYGAQVAEVEVERNTGAVKVLGIWAAHDGGVVIYPNGAKGQLIGGIAQGIGYALTEGFTFTDGIPEKLNFDKYKIPTSLDVPEIEIKFIETEFADGPFGAKNFAEPVMIATAPAIVNAIFQATRVRIRELPVKSHLLKY